MSQVNSDIIDATRSSVLGGIGVAAVVPVLMMLAFENPFDAFVFFADGLIIHAIVVAFATLASFVLPSFGSFFIACTLLVTGSVFIVKMANLANSAEAAAGAVTKPSREIPRMRKIGRDPVFFAVAAISALVFFGRVFAGDAQTARMYFSSPAFLSYSILVVVLASFVASVPKGEYPWYASALFVFLAVSVAWFIPFRAVNLLNENGMPVPFIDHSMVSLGMALLFVAFVSAYVSTYAEGPPSAGDQSGVGDPQFLWALPAQMALVVCGFMFSRANRAFASLVEILCFCALILLLAQRTAWNEQRTTLLLSLSVFLFFTSFTERNTGSAVSLVVPLATALAMAERVPDQGPAFVVGAAMCVFFRDRFVFSNFGTTRVFASLAISFMLLRMLSGRKDEERTVAQTGVDFAVFAGALLFALGLSAQETKPLFQIAIGIAGGAFLALAPRPTAPAPAPALPFLCSNEWAPALPPNEPIKS